MRGFLVDRLHRSRGIGKQLLDHVKHLHPVLLLSVYRKNLSAVAFYNREGFSAIEEGMDEDTGELERTMRWARREKETLQRRQ